MFEFIKGSTDFWSPIAYVWGLAILLFGVGYLTLIKKYRWLGWINVGFGIAFIMLGVFTTAYFGELFWAGILLRFSIPVLFFGITASRSNLKQGWLVILAGIVLLALGYLLAPVGE